MENTEKEKFDEIEGEETLSIEAKDFLKPEEEENPYPYENINIGRDNFSAFELHRKYKNGTIKMDPDFQRESNVWSPKQKSELIESILIGIPLPIIYVKQDKEGNYILIDGRQRLSTIFDFMENKFSLSGLKILSDFNGFFFNSKKEDEKSEKVLKIKYKGKIEDVSFTLHIIKEPTPEKLTYDLFDRVNRGGTRLNNQEMRNAIYIGSSTLFLKTLSKLESFKNVTTSISSTRMKDRYLILRFIAFYLWRKAIAIDLKTKTNLDYKSDLEDFLAKSMEFLNSKKFNANKELKIEDKIFIKGDVLYLNNENEYFSIEADDIYNELLYSFNKAMVNIFILFDNNSFRLPKKEGGTIRPINMALFEVATYFFIELENEFINKKETILKEFEYLIKNNEEFIGSLTYTVDSNKSVLKRFEIIEETINKIKQND